MLSSNPTNTIQRDAASVNDDIDNDDAGADHGAAARRQRRILLRRILLEEVEETCTHDGGVMDGSVSIQEAIDGHLDVALTV